MKWINFLWVCGLLTSGYVEAVTVVGPTPTVSTMQEYEIPGGAPADVYLWDHDFTGITDGSGYRGTYDCNNSALQQTCTHQSNGSTISMVLTERRSKMQHTFKVQAYLENLFYDNADPANSSYCGGKHSLNSWENWSCYNNVSSVITNSKTLTVWITQNEIKALPVGGIWAGQIKLKYSGGGTIDYIVNITLKGQANGKP